MGSSYDARGGGYSTGVHLHFTIKISGKAVNPLKFLP
jgi:murein DD-endopeptidase MepM/ murein hydrolase activator NlpD